MIIVHFDVLAQPGPDVPTRAPNPLGIELWRALKVQYKLVTLAYDNLDENHLAHWMAKYDISTPYQRELKLIGPDPKLKAQKIQLLMDSFGRTDWYVDVDVMSVNEAISLGIPSLLVCVPQITRPEWHDRAGPKSWESIQQELQNQIEDKAKRIRDWRDL